MTHPLAEEEFSDYLDGELPAERRRHARAPCRGLRRLRPAARRAAAGGGTSAGRWMTVPHAHDLWPGVAAAIGAATGPHPADHPAVAGAPRRGIALMFGSAGRRAPVAAEPGPQPPRGGRQRRSGDRGGTRGRGRWTGIRAAMRALEQELRTGPGRLDTLTVRVRGGEARPHRSGDCRGGAGAGRRSRQRLSRRAPDPDPAAQAGTAPPRGLSAPRGQLNSRGFHDAHPAARTRHSAPGHRYHGRRPRRYPARAVQLRGRHHRHHLEPALGPDRGRSRRGHPRGDRGRAAAAWSSMPAAATARRTSPGALPSRPSSAWSSPPRAAISA